MKRESGERAAHCDSCAGLATHINPLARAGHTLQVPMFPVNEYAGETLICARHFLNRVGFHPHARS